MFRPDWFNADDDDDGEDDDDDGDDDDDDDDPIGVKDVAMIKTKSYCFCNINSFAGLPYLYIINSH
jgi:hypothetical protein